jgi:outer membrane murein-binding lipoprotein Lpp
MIPKKKDGIEGKSARIALTCTPTEKRILRALAAVKNPTDGFSGMFRPAIEDLMTQARALAALAQELPEDVEALDAELERRAAEIEAAAAEG